MQLQSIRKDTTEMTAKIMVIIVASVAAVVGMYILGRCADKGDADANGKADSPSRRDAA